jgi:hypothetical protein
MRAGADMTCRLLWRVLNGDVIVYSRDELIFNIAAKRAMNHQEVLACRDILIWKL